ncbi:MAG: single-stranded-DNA-specific exonuclease RecJ [Candidatus Coatesbacteria bacterium]|nr:single-stranded-DNA-specific exonuclease RecJ [Candidatus Coatesbacteria bacterium]
MIWKLACQNHDKAREIADKLNVSALTGQILLNRGITDVNSAYDFLNFDQNKANDPFLFTNMHPVTDKIIDIIKKGKKILIYGDYDVDGSASCAILGRFFNSIDYNNFIFFQPNRLKDGYGFHGWITEYAKKKSVDLIITVDCGVTDRKAVEKANNEGMEVIVTDHHQIVNELPSNDLILLPSLKNDKGDCYPNQHIAGVGVAFQLARALARKMNKKIDWLPLMELLALGTVVDVAPLMGENRLFVYHGLKAIANTKILGLDSLIRISRLDKKNINTMHLGFYLGPRLNAAGRMGEPSLATELLLTDNPARAEKLAIELNKINSQRQDEQEKILKKMEMQLSEEASEDAYINFAVGKDLHAGIIGLVASKLQDNLYKPTIVISLSKNIGVGSCRSIPEFNIIDALRKFQGYFLRLGGHPQAAGFTIDEKNINKLKSELNTYSKEILKKEDLIPKLEIDAVIPIESLSLDLINEIGMLAPFGNSNNYPILASYDLQVIDKRKLSEGKHIKIYVKSKTQGHLETIGWNMGYLFDKLTSPKINMVYEPETNYFNGITKIQLKIRDIQFS